MYKLFQNIF